MLVYSDYNIEIGIANWLLAWKKNGIQIWETCLEISAATVYNNLEYKTMGQIQTYILYTCKQYDNNRMTMVWQAVWDSLGTKSHPFNRGQNPILFFRLKLGAVKVVELIIKVGFDRKPAGSTEKKIGDVVSRKTRRKKKRLNIYIYIYIITWDPFANNKGKLIFSTSGDPLPHLRHNHPVMPPLLLPLTMRESSASRLENHATPGCKCSDPPVNLVFRSLFWGFLSLTHSSYILIKAREISLFWSRIEESYLQNCCDFRKNLSGVWDLRIDSLPSSSSLEMWRWYLCIGITLMQKMILQYCSCLADLHWTPSNRFSG